jgi:sporulation protein YlmC with PRC-barrel domain
MSYADRDKYGIYKHSAGAGVGPMLIGAHTLIGDSVVNGAGEDLGDIKEIMLDMDTGQVAYAVLAFGGFLGLGEKLFAVPWQALQLDIVQKRFVLDVDKDRLKSAPGFDPANWPDMSDVQWATELHTFYGTDPTVGGVRRTDLGARDRPMRGSVDPRPGTGGSDTDLSHIRGSNIG